MSVLPKLKLARGYCRLGGSRGNTGQNRTGRVKYNLPQAVQVPGDQPAFTVFDIADRTEAVVLQLEQKGRIAKGVADQSRRHRLDAGYHHSILSKMSMK